MISYTSYQMRGRFSTLAGQGGWDVLIFDPEMATEKDLPEVPS